MTSMWAWCDRIYHSALDLCGVLGPRRRGVGGQCRIHATKPSAQQGRIALSQFLAGTTESFAEFGGANILDPAT